MVTDSGVVARAASPVGSGRGKTEVESLGERGEVNQVRVLIYPTYLELWSVVRTGKIWRGCKKAERVESAYRG